MIANKATSTPLNPKSKMQNQGGEDWVQEHYLVLLVKMQELRSFDVFFFLECFLGFFFGCEKREKKKKKSPKHLPKTKFFNFGPIWGARGYLQPLAHFPRLSAPCRAVGSGRRPNHGALPLWWLFEFWLWRFSQGSFVVV